MAEHAPTAWSAPMSWSAGTTRDAWSDGLPLAPPEASRVDALAATLARSPGELVGGRVGVREMAVLAAMAGCPDDVLPLAVAALEEIVAPLPGLTVDPAWNGHWPMLVARRETTERLGLESSYGALGTGHANLALGRTVTLALRAFFGFRNDAGLLGAISHPGSFSAVAAERPDSPVPVAGTRGRHDLWLAATGPFRGAYVGGGRGSVPRILEILADSIAAGLPAAVTPSVAVLVAVSPPTADVVARHGLDAFLEALTARMRELCPDCEADRLDVLLVDLGGETQTWCAVASGPPGSAWVPVTHRPSEEVS